MRWNGRRPIMRWLGGLGVILAGCAGADTPHRHYLTATPKVFLQCVPPLLESQGAIVFRDPVVPSLFFVSWGTGPLASVKAKAQSDDTGFSLTFLQAGTPAQQVAMAAWLTQVGQQVSQCEGK